MYGLEDFLGLQTTNPKTHRMEGLMMNQNVRTAVVLLVLLLVHVSTTTATTSGTSRNESKPIEGTDLLIPVEPTVYRTIWHPYSSGNGGEGGRGRRLAPFQQCAQCKCCAKNGDPSTCKNIPCCYGIVCNIPGKPFGVCAFRPKSCNCNTCK